MIVLLNFQQSYKIMQSSTYQIAEQRRTLPSRGLKTSPPIWMDQKRDRDQQLYQVKNSKCWIIENKMYDLSNFINKHPGGESWIRLTQGQDITEHFIVHHMNEKKARDLLPKYYIGDCPKKINRFTFQEQGLYRTVKSRLLSKYSVEQLQDQSRSKVYAMVILTLWVLLISLAIIKNSYLFGMLCSPFMVGLVGVGHNFVHHKQSIYRYFFLFVGFTHKQWQIMHCISHHVFPNTELDYQNAAFEPVGYYLRNMPQNKWYFQIILQIILVFLQPINMTLKLVVIPITKKRRPDFLYSFPLFILLLCTIQNNLTDAIKLYLVIYCSFSFLLMKVLFCGHRVQDTWTEGSEKILDYGEHTVYATSDTDAWIEGFWSYILLAGFNIHIAHHFFPTADHKAMPKINELIKQVCLERGIKKNDKSRIECVISLNKGFLNRIPFVKK